MFSRHKKQSEDDNFHKNIENTNLKCEIRKSSKMCSNIKLMELGIIH